MENDKFESKIDKIKEAISRYAAKLDLTDNQILVVYRELFDDALDNLLESDIIENYDDEVIDEDEDEDEDTDTDTDDEYADEDEDEDEYIESDEEPDPEQSEKPKIVPVNEKKPISILKRPMVKVKGMNKPSLVQDV